MVPVAHRGAASSSVFTARVPLLMADHAGSLTYCAAIRSCHAEGNERALFAGGRRAQPQPNVSIAATYAVAAAGRFA
jgi:hypothetical protein